MNKTGHKQAKIKYGPARFYCTLWWHWLEWNGIGNIWVADCYYCNQGALVSYVICTNHIMRYECTHSFTIISRSLDFMFSRNSEYNEMCNIPGHTDSLYMWHTQPALWWMTGAWKPAWWDETSGASALSLPTPQML
jgi:hypothetical protein